MPQCTEPNLSGRFGLSVDLRNRIEPVPSPDSLGKSQAQFEQPFAHPGLEHGQYRSGCAPMQSARYLRSQAALCLELAQQISNRREAERLRIAAADYFRRAVDAERQSEMRAPPSSSEV